MALSDSGSGPSKSDSDSLSKALSEYLAVPGVLGGLFVSDEGLVVSQAIPEDLDADVIAVFAADAVVACQRLGGAVSAGALETLEIEFENRQMLVVPVASGVSLLLLLDQGQAARAKEGWRKLRESGANSA